MEDAGEATARIVYAEKKRKDSVNVNESKELRIKSAYAVPNGVAISDPFDRIVRF